MGTIKNLNKRIILLTAIIFLVSIISVQGYNRWTCESECGSNCDAQCPYNPPDCRAECSHVTDYIYWVGCQNQCYNKYSEERAKCTTPCVQAKQTCKLNCALFWNAQVKYKRKEIYLDDNDMDKFLEIRQQGRCGEWECCEGYYMADIDINICCPDGQILSDKGLECVSPEPEVIEIIINKKSISNNEQNTGKIVCKGDCSTLAYLDVEDFKVELIPPLYLGEKTKEVAFILTPKDNLKTKKVTVNGPKGSTTSFQYSSSIDDFKIEVSEDTVKQHEKVKFNIKVDGPNTIKYTYILTSFQDSTFYIDEEYPIAALYTGGNTLSFEWKTPTISRKVRAVEFYLDETGQLGAELMAGGVKALMLDKLGSVISNGLRGREKWLNEITDYATEKTIVGADTIATYSSDGFIPAGITGIGALGPTGSAVSAGLGAGYSFLTAYNRATERYNAFASDKIHEYNVPVEITVKPDGYPGITKKIKIKVIAPEVIYE